MLANDVTSQTILLIGVIVIMLVVLHDACALWHIQRVLARNIGYMNHLWEKIQVITLKFSNNTTALLQLLKLEDNMPTLSVTSMMEHHDIVMKVLQSYVRCWMKNVYSDWDEIVKVQDNIHLAMVTKCDVVLLKQFVKDYNSFRSECERILTKRVFVLPIPETWNELPPELKSSTLDAYTDES